MGESRGGGGVERSVTTSDYAAMLVASYIEDDRHPEVILIRTVDVALFAVNVKIRDEEEDERFFVRVDVPSPTGTTRGDRGDG